MLRPEPTCTSVANPHTVNNGGAYPQVALPHGSECRCDVTLERILNALLSADERLRAARSERAGWAAVCACVRVTEHSAPYGS